MLNIGGDKADISYRYKMPRLMTKFEGRGNGIKTVITNMLDVAKALHVDPTYPVKYFGMELGAQTRFHQKTNRAVINGHHDAHILTRHLDKFIRMFVLCSRCDLPEVTMSSTTSRVIVECAACGHSKVLGGKHRLVSFIQKHSPPPMRKVAPEMALNHTDEDEQNVEWFSDTSLAAVQQRQLEACEAPCSHIRRLLQNAEIWESLIDPSKPLAPSLKGLTIDTHVLLDCLANHVEQTDQVSLSPRIFLTLYENGVVEEEAFVHWYHLQKPTKLKSNLYVIIDWLQNAEEEESEEEVPEQCSRQHK